MESVTRHVVSLNFTADQRLSGREFTKSRRLDLCQWWDFLRYSQTCSAVQKLLQRTARQIVPGEKKQKEDSAWTLFYLVSFLLISHSLVYGSSWSSALHFHLTVRSTSFDDRWSCWLSVAGISHKTARTQSHAANLIVSRISLALVILDVIAIELRPLPMVNSTDAQREAREDTLILKQFVLKYALLSCPLGHAFV